MFCELAMLKHTKYCFRLSLPFNGCLKVALNGHKEKQHYYYKGHPEFNSGSLPIKNDEMLNRVQGDGSLGFTFPFILKKSSI